MDRNVTARFYKITPLHSSAPSFEDALRMCFESDPSPVNRERDVGKEVKVRIEKFAADGAYFAGEMVRRQSSNIPPEANDEGLVPLAISVNGGLGHCVAFRYHPGLQILAMQFDTKAVSINRMLAYLEAFDKTLDYQGKVIVRADAWERYNRGDPRSFDIEIANPESLAHVEGDAEVAIQGSKSLAEMFDGPLIRIHVSMGTQRKGHLRKSMVDSVVNFFTSGGGQSADVRHLEVRTKPIDGGATELVDFLEEVLFKTETLDLPERQHDAHYVRRKAFLKSAMDDNLEYLRSAYSG